MQAKKILNTVDPFQEMIAFETLWALDGMTESKLTKLFKNDCNTSTLLLPTQVLERFSKIDPNSIALIQSEILSYIKTKIGRFSVCLNGDFQYPADLRKVKHPIELFYYGGNLDLLNAPSISIVGATEASHVGTSLATRMA